MSSWQLQEAKERFSEFLDAALKKGPQVVTRRGVEAAVLVPIEEWRRLQHASRPSITELLLSAHRFENIVPPTQKVEAPPTYGVRVTRYLLDTNIISEIRKPRPHGAVVAWFGACGMNRSVFGQSRSANCKRSLNARVGKTWPKPMPTEAWVDELENSLTVLPMDGRCLRETAA